MARGETIGRAYVRILADGSDFGKELRREMNANKGSFEKAGRDHGDAYAAGFEDEVHRRPLLNGLKQDLAQGKGQFDALGVTLGGSLMKNLEKELKKSFPGVGKTIFTNLKRDMETGALAVDDLGARLRNIGPDFDRAMTQIRNGSGKGVEGINRVRDSVRRFTDSTGRAFGKGSRNDFLNFFGGFVTMAPKVISGILGVASSIGGLGQKLRIFRSEGGGVTDVLLGIGKGASGMVLAAASIAAMASTVVAALGPLSSALVLTSGLVLALAGSLGFALVGALGAVGGALIPFGVAIGVGALAMAGLQKIGGKALKGLKKDWEGLQKTVAKQVFGKNLEGVKGLRGSLKAVSPVIEAVAKALGGLLTSFNKATQSKGFQKLMADIAKVMGPMVTTIGKIAGNIGTFLLEAFRDVSPHIQDFLGWLEKVTKGWADFGKQGKGGGKSKLALFFDEAVKSGKIVWDLIKNVGKAILLLFDAGKGTGDSLFKGMADQVGKFVTWLQDPASQKTLKTWFADAKKLGVELGNLVLKVIKFVDALDTPENRVMLMWIIKAVEKLIDVFTWVATKVGQFNTALGLQPKVVAAYGATKTFFTETVPGWFTGIAAKVTAGWDSVKTFFTVTVPGWFTGISDKVTTGWDGVKTFFTTTVPGWFTSLGTNAQGGLDTLKQKITEVTDGTAWDNMKTHMTQATDGTAWDSLKTRATQAWTGIQSAWGTAGTFFGTIGTAIQTAWTPVQTFFTTTVPGWFSGLATKIFAAAGNIATEFGTWLAGLPVKVITIVGQIVVGFAGLAGKIVDKAGDLGARFAQWVVNVPARVATVVVNILVAFAGLAGKAVNKAGNLAAAFAKWVSAVPGRIRAFVAGLPGAFANLAGKFIAKAGNLAARFASWVSSLPGKARTLATQVANAFSNLAGKVISKAGSLASKFASWVQSVPGKAKKLASDIANAFTGLADKAIKKAGSIVAAIGKWASGVGSAAKKVAGDIVNAFSGLAGKIVNAIGSIRLPTPTVPMPNFGAVRDAFRRAAKGLAAGGIVGGAQYRLIGEAGPEAVVPLNRPLNLVDPAVRALSAFAQGISMPSSSDSGGGGPLKHIEVGGITINTPTENPRAVASEVIARMTAASYI